MFSFFDNFGLSKKNGVSATISIKDWLKILSLNLLSVMPLFGTLTLFVVYVALASRKNMAPSLSNYFKANVIYTAIFLVLFFALKLF